MNRNLTLGIDIGTTKVAAAIADPKVRVVLESVSFDHGANVPNQNVPGSAEQSTNVIFSAVTRAVRSLNPEARAKVGSIGITGQMHGVVLFNPDSVTHSTLITWQDERCNHDGFLTRLHDWCGDNSLKSGFGISTLAWLAEHDPKYLKQFSGASTIHGLLATRLCGCRGGMDPSDAASFGLFDILSRTWKCSAIEQCGVNTALLPPIIQAPEVFGTLQDNWAEEFGLASEIPVLTPIGDNQASLYGSLSSPQSQIALTIGTGAQVSVVLHHSPTSLPGHGAKYEIRPYLDGHYIAVGASLGGGRTLAAFAHALQEFIGALGITPVPELDKVYSTLQVLAGTRLSTDMRSVTSLAGERFDPTIRGSFTNLSFDNFTIGDMFAALSRGLVVALKEMLPAELYHGMTEVVGSGNAIRRSTIMQRYIQDVFGCRVIVTPGGETTCSGAAFLAGRVLE